MTNKSNLQTFLRVSMFLLAMAGLAQAATITVGMGASYDFETIQAGIDAANDADTVLVAPGEYVITEPITFRGKTITVKSEAGPDKTTIRMGTPADPERGSVVVFENDETVDSVLDGFTITGGRGCWFIDPYPPGNRWSGWTGGGILCWEASPSIVTCTITQNGADHGAGVVCLHSNAILTDCIIEENSSGIYVGGVSISSESSATLTNCIISGNSTAGGAGGVLCWDRSLATLTNCIIRGNASGSEGGGVACSENSTITMTDCGIMSNKGYDYFGGGVYVGHSSATLTNCIIAQNTVALGGGGVACSYSDASMTINNCTIWGNSAGDWDWGGGGVLCRQASAIVTNSIIWGNTAPKGREISVQDAVSRLTITYSSVVGGQTGVSVEGGCTLDWGVGNIDADPHFAEPGYWADINDPNIIVRPDDPNAVWIDGDYHLKSEAGRWDPNNQSWVQDAVTSPCIDAGDPNSDWRAELWPHGMRVNMGAYGGTLQASRSLSDSGNIADLNRDRIVDSVDMCMMVDHWHKDDPYCDIAPALFGDGIIDVQDLIVFAENLFVDYRMIAHWKLDDTEGEIAYNSVFNCDGILVGDPVWQPGDGIVDGALQFDGIDDYVSTEFVLNPAGGMFSVFAWIKGGAPGQVVISQQVMADWLAADSGGNLMTELKCTGRFACPLFSETVITDGQWHRIGLVWDDSYRILYVDGIEVAKDTTAQNPLKSATGGLYIGAGKTLSPGNFFSGLIDDVRIYNQVLSAEQIEALAQ